MDYMSRRKSTPHHTPFLSYELQNIIAGGVLITLAVLMFLSASESSVIGIYMSRAGIALFGEYYPWIFAPIVMILGVMILVKRASWSASRLVGLILFWLSTTSLIGWYTRSTVGYLDIYHLLERLLGASSALIALIVLWFVALYLTLRISYRAILSKVRESVPSIRNMRDAIIPSDDDEDIIPAKR